MHRSVGVIVLVGLVLRLEAQDSLAQRYAASISPMDLRAHLYFLADDLLEGRETGQRGQHLAALYIRTRFMGMGLPGGNGGEYDQRYYLARTTIDSASIQVGGQRYDYGVDFMAAEGQLPDTLSGDLTFVGYGIQSEDYDNLSKLKLRGDIAVMLAGGPQLDTSTRLLARLQTWRNRCEALAAAGARAVLIILPDSVYRPVSRYARRSFSGVSDGSKPGIPVLYLSESLGDALLTLAGADVPSLQLELATSDKPDKLRFKQADFALRASVQREALPAQNVLAYLEGTDRKDELVVVTAHYDHIGINGRGEVNNGADDDASGTSGVLEIAQAFALAAQEGHRPRRSLLFMTVSGEEKGLLGSEFYADHPVYPLAQTVANLNIDMIGRIDERYEGGPDSTGYVYVIGSDRLSSELHAINEAANETYTRLRLDYKYNADNDPNRFYYRSDHYNFAEKGIPIIFYFNGTHADYHRPGDDPDKINYDKLARISQLVFYTAWELAWRDSRIVVDKSGE
ncbi:MAG: hypothetical protein OHK0039_11950 [Bacteroidia bacterium]